MLLPNSRFKLHKHRIKPPARANEALIKSVETACDIRLPDEFKQFYRFSDGFETVEDLFNMIPLSEIIDRKLYHNGHLYIAEYMTYGDRWELEVNAFDANSYSITNRDRYNNKLVLTHSLTEFIDRFLKGGVFETDGLYDWHDEVRATL